MDWQSENERAELWRRKANRYRRALDEINALVEPLRATTRSGPSGLPVHPWTEVEYYDMTPGSDRTVTVYDPDDADVWIDSIRAALGKAGEP